MPTMPDRTEAEQHRDNARRYINGAAKELSMILVYECPGHEEFSRAYRERLRRALAALVELQEDF